MKKNMGQFAIAAIVIFAIAVSLPLSAHYFVKNTETFRRAVRETEIIEGVNIIELLKRLLPQALEYSYYQASYSLASRGGYTDLTTVESHNNIPYWRMYDKTYYPDVKENLQIEVSNKLNEYMKIMREKTNLISIPQYSIEIIDSDEKLTLMLKSDKLKLKGPNFIIEDVGDFSVDSAVRVLKMFEIAKENFITKDSVGERLNTAVDYNDAKNQISQLQTELNILYGLDDFQFVLTPEENLGPNDSEFSMNVLVTIKDLSSKYPVYDYQERTISFKNIQLKFYILAGNYNILR